MERKKNNGRRERKKGIDRERERGGEIDVFVMYR